MISKLSRAVAKLDLGFVLIRVTLMIPIVIATRRLDQAEFGDYSQMYHQLLIVSSVMVFGVHDRITVTGVVAVREEMLSLGLRVALLLPVVLFYPDLGIALATLLFLLISRSGPMILLASTRALGRATDYMLVCLAVTLSTVVFCVGYGLAWSTLTTTVAATAVMIPGAAAVISRSSAPATSAFSVRRALTGWDYCLNFLLTSFFTQGVLFLTSFVTTASEYAIVSRVMYLVQAGLILQTVAYRMVLSLLVDRSINIRQVLAAHGALGVLWFLCMVLAGGWIETVVFGNRELGGAAYVFVGAIVMLQTFNLALAPYLLAGHMVRRTLWVPAASAVVAGAFALSWNSIDSPNTIYAMIASVSVTGLVIRIVLVRRMGRLNS